MPWKELNDLLGELGGGNIEYKPGPGGQPDQPPPQGQQPLPPHGSVWGNNGLDPSWNYQQQNQLAKPTSNTMQQINRMDPRSQGMNGEPLPPGAKGWTPQGEAWYGGDSPLSEALAKANAQWKASNGRILPSLDSIGLTLGNLYDQWVAPLGVKANADAAKAMQMYAPGQPNPYQDKAQGLQQDIQKSQDAKKADAGRGEANIAGTIIDSGIGVTLGAFSEGAKRAEQGLNVAADALQASQGNKELSKSEIDAFAKKEASLVNKPSTPLGYLLDTLGVFGSQKQQLDQQAAQMESRVQEALTYHNELTAKIRAEGGPTSLGQWWQQSVAPPVGKTSPAQEAWDAGRIAYTAALEGPRKQAELIARVRAGEDPYLVALELENPLAEAAGQMIIDPTNLLLAPLGKMVKSIKTARQAEAAVGLAPEITEAIGKAQSFGGKFSTTAHLGSEILDEATAASKFDKVVEGTQALGKRVSQGIEAWQDVNYNPFQLTRNAKVQQMTGIVNDTLGLMSAGLRNNQEPEMIYEAVENLIKLSSKNPEEVAAGVRYALSSPNMSLMLSDYGMKTSQILRGLIGETDGALDATKFGKQFMSAFEKGGQEAALKWAMGRSYEAAKLAFPEAITADLKTTPVHNFLQKYAFGPARNAMSAAYLRFFNPAFALRNLQTNTVITAVDQGLEGVMNTFKPGRNQEFILSRVGQMPDHVTGMDVTAKVFGGDVKPHLWANVEEAIGEFAKDLKNDNPLRQFDLTNGDIKKIKKAIESGTSAADIVKDLQSGNGIGLSDFLFNNIKVNGRMEDIASLAITRTEWQKVENAMYQIGKGVPDVAPLKAAGWTDAQINRMVSLVKEHGNPVTALEKFKQEYATGLIRNGHDLDHLVGPENAKALRELFIHDEIADVLKNENATKEDMLAAIANYVKKADGEVKAAAGDVQEVLDNNEFSDLLESIGRALDPEGTGNLDKPATKAVIDHINENQFSNNAWRSAVQEAQAAIGKSNLPEDVRAQLIQRIQNAGAEVDQAKAAYNATIPIRDQVIAFEKKITAAVKDKARMQELIDQSWKALKMPGEAPTGKMAYNQWRHEVWDALQEVQRRTGIAYRDAYAEQFAPILKDVQAAMPGYKTQLDEAYTQWLRAKYYDVTLDRHAVQPLVKNAVKTKNNALYAKMMARSYAQSEDANDVLKVVNEWSGQNFKTLREVPQDVAEKAYSTYFSEQAGQAAMAGKGGIEGLFAGETVLPRPTGLPSQGQMLSGTAAKRKILLEGLINAVNSKWDDVTPVFDKPGMMEALDAWQPANVKRWNEIQAIAERSSVALRDFALHNYANKTYADVAAAYLFPFQYWYSRTYATWLQRLIYNPEVISRYAIYRDTMAKLHAGAPDWWKYNVNTNELLGLNWENPLYFNLEQTINPVNALTSVDYNDPKKRFDTFSSFVDDLGKFGPSLHPAIGLGMALYAKAKNQDEAAARWAGRMIPQTNIVKTITGLIAPTKYPGGLELDPYVRIFSGGTDPFEQARIGRELYGLVQSGQIDQRTALEATRYSQGMSSDPAAKKAWEDAQRAALAKRGPANILSWMFGVGYKARSNSDMQIDQMDTARAALMNKRDLMAPDEYSTAWREFRKKYPFADSVLLSRKSGLEASEAYAYNVLARIPPAKTDEFAKAVGLDYGLLNKFYDSKGNTKTWAQADQNKLFTAMGELGAILDLPDNATADEWNTVKATYKQMLATLDAQVPGGKTAYETFSDLYNKKGADAAYQFADSDPRYYAYKNLKQQMVMGDPLLARYYGSIDDIEKVQKSLMYDALNARFPNNQALTQAFNDTPTNQRTAFLAKNPELKQYWDAKKDYEKQAAYMMDQMGQTISRLAPPKMPTYTAPANPSLGQTNAMSLINQMGQPQASIYNRSYEDWVKTLKLSPATQNALTDNLLLGKKLSNAAQSNLEYAATKAGIPYALMLKLLSGAATQR